MELISTALISVEEAEAILQIPIELRERTIWCINAMSATAHRLSGRIICERVNEEMYLEGHAGRCIIVPAFPLTVVSALYLDRTREFGLDTLIPAESYDVDQDAGLIYLLDRLAPKGRRTIKLVATIGYTEIPADVKQATIEGVSWLMDRFNDHAIGVATISSSEGINTAYERYLPPSIKDVFRGYRVERV